MREPNNDNRMEGIATDSRTGGARVDITFASVSIDGVIGLHPPMAIEVKKESERRSETALYPDTRDAAFRVG